MFWRRKKRELGAGDGPRFEAPTSDVRTLKPGDVVNYEGRDYIIEGTITFDEDGFVWHEHHLVEGEDKLWLSVEDDEGLEVAVWRRLRGSTLEPGAAAIEHDGVGYERDERGRARFTAEGSTGTGPSGRAEYADYQAGEKRLSFERYGEDGAWEVGLGQLISEHALDIYPGRGL